MKNNATFGIVAIILGIIMLICPIFGLISQALLIGIPILGIGFFALLTGVIGNKNIVSIILGVLVLIFGFLIIFNPEVLSYVIGFIIYITAIILLIVSIMGLFNEGSKYGAVFGIIIAVIYLIIGNLFINDPKVLGILIGLWLLFAGLNELFLRK